MGGYSRGTIKKRKRKYAKMKRLNEDTALEERLKGQRQAEEKLKRMEILKAKKKALKHKLGGYLEQEAELGSDNE